MSNKKDKIYTFVSSPKKSNNLMFWLGLAVIAPACSIAGFYGYKECKKRESADIFAKENQTKLLFAVLNNDIKTAKACLKQGGNANLPQNGRTLLMEAAGSVEMMTLLWDYGADISQRDAEGKSVVCYAVLKYNPCADNHSRSVSLSPVRYLYYRGADVNTPDKTGKTPLHYAAALNNAQCVEELLQCGANPNAADDTGKTPLMYAVRVADFNMMRSLLYSGANPYATDNEGKSMADYAVYSSNPHAVKLFRHKPFSPYDIKDFEHIKEN